MRLLQRQLTRAPTATSPHRVPVSSHFNSHVSSAPPRHAATTRTTRHSAGTLKQGGCQGYPGCQESRHVRWDESQRDQAARRYHTTSLGMTYCCPDPSCAPAGSCKSLAPCRRRHLMYYSCSGCSTRTCSCGCFVRKISATNSCRDTTAQAHQGQWRRSIGM